MNNYEMKNNLVKVGENKGRNAILNMYRIPNTVKYYGVVRFNNFAYSFFASERIGRATIYGFKGTLEELDKISAAIQAHMRPNREPIVLAGLPSSPVYEKRYFYDYLEKGLLIYKVPGVTDKGEEKYLGYVTSHAFVAYKKKDSVVVLYKNIRYIFSVNKYNRKPSTGTDEKKLRAVVLKLIYNVDKQLDDALNQKLQEVASEISIDNLSNDDVKFDISEF